MTEPIIPIVPVNPGIFPVPPVRLPRIDQREHDERRHEQEDDERERERARQRRREENGGRLPREGGTRPLQAPSDDGLGHIDTTA
jgi:hypothetical protein